MTQIFRSVLARIENIQEKEENAGNNLHFLLISNVFKRNYCGKRRKCWLPAFSPFPTMLLKDFLFKTVKKKSGLCGKKLSHSHPFAAAGSLAREIQTLMICCKKCYMKIHTCITVILTCDPAHDYSRSESESCDT